MKQQYSDYQVVPYSKLRRLMAAEFRLSHRMPLIHGLLEVDVSRARAFLRDHKAKTGESLSFTAFLIACLAQAVEEHKAVQAMRLGRKRLILFEDVDVLTYIERGEAGHSLPMPYIIRAANSKTVREFIARFGPPRCRTWQRPRWVSNWCSPCPPPSSASSYGWWGGIPGR